MLARGSQNTVLRHCSRFAGVNFGFLPNLLPTRQLGSVRPVNLIILKVHKVKPRNACFIREIPDHADPHPVPDHIGPGGQTFGDRQLRNDPGLLCSKPRRKSGQSRAGIHRTRNLKLHGFAPGILARRGSELFRDRALGPADLRGPPEKAAQPRRTVRGTLLDNDIEPSVLPSGARHTSINGIPDPSRRDEIAVHSLQHTLLQDIQSFIIGDQA